MGENILILAVRFVAAIFASMFFGIRFEAPRRTLIASSVLGAVGYAIYLALLDSSLPLAFFLSTFVCCISSEFLARSLKTPTTVLSFVAVIPLVPGIMLYNTMLEFARGNTPAALEMCISTLVATGCMALAVTVASLIGKIVIRPVEHFIESNHTGENGK